VRSIDGYSKRSSNNPLRAEINYNFATLGENMSSSWPISLSENGKDTTRWLSGTSVSTVIAAAMAVTVLHYAKCTLAPVASANDLVRYKLRSRFGMRQLLKLTGRTVDDYTYLAPWHLFQKDLEWDDANRTMLQVLSNI